ncbi:hypothetical protein H310_08690 [Aphanomyces invadans]|uniref:Elicitin n=1 Tax=Aphanomyces invadans TaxID=157072 RepID=A0A024TY49_9STRA|nr:hypothetical protein H310_08690 [Aphanomyces invadans]ETV98566.1 hypothetical protein H310_08690 [Aphanomyces invadans]RHY25099.1 hypothetical protein DYB32_008518 [Aphanomyces invadans]|eukprot:XP_008872763.1 hypothetical protein H310_08690 [Aphanomyces invadans]
MKSAVALGVLTIVSAVSAAPCEIGTVLSNLTPLMTDPNLAKCATDSGYNFIVSGASGIPPTDEEVAKLSSSESCKALYASLGGIVSKITPSCTLGGVETSTFATLTIPEALKAIFSAIKSANVTNPIATTVAPTTVPTPTTTPKSSAVTSAISLATVGLAVYAMAN